MINKCNWRREGKGKGQREACKTAFEMDRRGKGIEKNGREREGKGDCYHKLQPNLPVKGN